MKLINFTIYPCFFLFVCSNRFDYTVSVKSDYAMVRPRPIAVLLMVVCLCVSHDL